MVPETKKSSVSSLIGATDQYKAARSTIDVSMTVEQQRTGVD